jgi:hypothetical protein
MIPKIEANVAKFRQNNPDVHVEVVNKFANDLKASEPYDVSCIPTYRMM